MYANICRIVCLYVCDACMQIFLYACICISMIVSMCVLKASLLAEFNVVLYLWCYSDHYF